jgi:uncharacterized membrane protein
MSEAQSYQAPAPAPQAQFVSQSSMPLAVYILYIIGFFTGLTALIGVILAHMNSNDADPIVASHSRYQVRTFWWGLLWLFIGGLTSFIVIGWFVLLAWFIWTVIRIVKGFNALNQKAIIL